MSLIERHQPRKGPGTAAAVTGGWKCSLDMLQGVIPDSRLVEVLRFEIEALEQLPPAATEHPPAGAPARAGGSNSPA